MNGTWPYPRRAALLVLFFVAMVTISNVVKGRPLVASLTTLGVVVVAGLVMAWIYPRIKT